ncbi:MAG: hypothetical protein QF486_01730 [Candidatus Woesearchaeota archaeon]|jgi:hypothetical protein|nr:hypothetical protein [Candidatus Woesearchaeota archaeon]MDP7181067.1 hypothetical protein [Candidatus Woesearchaeota archaeon]MDP7198312.1 hypothetical protein [Candidatus Woesearchaeota archaeon]MDP7467414.1 hypothetical protein [Candidatus Woesearchaeota archaeon]
MSDLIDTYVRLCDEYRENEIPVLTQEDIPTHAEWEHAEPVRSMCKHTKKMHVLDSLKNRFSIAHVPVLQHKHEPQNKDVVIHLLKNQFRV